jgi:hypothetical protein
MNQESLAAVVQPNQVIRQQLVEVVVMCEMEHHRRHFKALEAEVEVQEAQELQVSHLDLMTRVEVQVAQV